MAIFSASSSNSLSAAASTPCRPTASPSHGSCRLAASASPGQEDVLKLSRFETRSGKDYIELHPRCWNIFMIVQDEHPFASNTGEWMRPPAYIITQLWPIQLSDYLRLCSCPKSGLIDLYKNFPFITRMHWTSLNLNNCATRGAFGPIQRTDDEDRL